MDGIYVENAIFEPMANKTIDNEDEMFQEVPEKRNNEEKTLSVDTANPELTEQEALAVLGVKEWDDYPPIETFSYCEDPELLVVNISEEDVILEKDEANVEDQQEENSDMKKKDEKEEFDIDTQLTEQNALIS